jgi:quinol-cytochrome oxidoreductase complex cytochrome b subunit
VGGPEPGLSSLERFYTWHVFVLTFAVIVLGGWHIFRVRRDGGIAVPPPQQRTDNVRISRFDLVRREVKVMVIGGVILLFLAIVFPAPIEAPITSSSMEVQDASAPWFFLWVQQLLKLGDAFTYGVLAPSLVLLLLALLPYVFPQAGDQELGNWLPRGNRFAQIIVVLVALAIILLTILSIIPTTNL